MSNEAKSGGPQVLPFYIVCDESQSMAGAGIDAINAGLQDIHRAIASDPVVSDKAYLGVISFSDTGEVLVPCSDMSKLNDMPGCAVRGSTSYGAAFSTLKSQIEVDVARIRSEGKEVLRPVAFFITDGEPTDEPAWRSEFAALVSPANPYRPHVISFGVGGADADVIRELATKVDRLNTSFAYMADNGVSPGPALKEILQKLAASIVGSARAQGTAIQPPTNIPGVIALDPLP